jgi:peroxiredoxin
MSENWICDVPACPAVMVGASRWTRRVQLSVLHFALPMLVAVSGATGASAADGDAILHWRSGDSLPGQLIEITNEQLVWESAIFKRRLELNRSVLSSIQFVQQPAKRNEADEFRVALHTGDVVFGRLDSLDADTLVLTCSRHGQIQIPRSRLGAIERVNHEGMLFLGPSGLVGWSGSGLESKWTEATDGSLTSCSSDADLYRQLRKEDRLAIEVILSFDRRADFIMALGKEEDISLRLETWDDTLVALSGFDFQEVMTLDRKSKTIHLLLYVDFTDSRLLVCSPEGKTLAELHDVSVKGISPRLIFRNGSGKLTLEHLRIERWNGTSVGSLVRGKTGLQQTDGVVRYGTLDSLSNGQVTLSGESGPETVALSEVGAIEVSVPNADDATEVKNAKDSDKDQEKTQETPTEVAETVTSDTEGQVRMKWRDGEMLTGQLLSMADGVAIVRPSWSDEPFKAALNGMQTIQLFEAQSSPHGPDELVIDGRLMHGELLVDAGDQPVSWKPTGSANAVALRSGGNAVVTRSAKSTAVSVDAEQYPDTIYLQNNDILPCHLESITEKAVRLSSPFASAKEFPSADIKALELSSTHQHNNEGFSAPEWRRVRGRLKKDGESVELKSGSFGRADGMVSDRLSFHAAWPPGQWSFMTVHLFADELRRPKTSSSCTFMFSDNNVVVTDNFDRQNPFASMQNQQGQIQENGQTASIELVTGQGQMAIHVNGKLAKQFPLKQDGAGNTGVLFELTQTGNGQLFGGQAGFRRQLGAAAEKKDAAQKKVAHLTLSRLETGSPSGASIRQFINEQTRLYTLTIPRFRRDDPATHALIAPNGDVLRGRLIGIRPDSVEFESRLESFRFPRERVAAVVWIKNPPEPKKKPVDGEPPLEKKPEIVSAETTVLQTVLNGGFLVSMTPVSLSQGLLHGESPVLGECNVPANAISRLYLGNPDERQSTAAYSQWKARHAMEPDWDIAKSEGGSSAGSELVGHAAPDFELPQLDGKTFRLSEHAGKIVVLDFWATWCGPCVAALPDYVEATKHFDESELVFVAVNIEEAPQQIRAFLSKHELDVRVAIDGGSEVASAYQVNGIPHSLIISPAGTIEYVHVGYDSDAGAEIQRIAEAILSGLWIREAIITPETDTTSE